MSFDPLRVADALLDARLRRARIDRLDPEIAPRTEEEGAAAQLALARRVGAEPPAGFKIGATGRRMQAYLGLSGPAAGFMAGPGLHRSGAELHFPGLSRIGVECEIAVRLGSDLPAGPCSHERAAAAIGAVMAGIEVVENRYGDLATLGTPSLIADQVFHLAAVIGEGSETLAPSALASLAGRIVVSGETRGEGMGSELLGDPVACLAWLAGSAVARAFGGLRAGQVVMLGSVTPPIWLSGPAEVKVAFAGLPEVRATLA